MTSILGAAARHAGLLRPLRATKRRAQRYLADRGLLPGAVVAHPVLADVQRVRAHRNGHVEPASSHRQARVLFFTFRGWTTHAVWESVIAAALKQRGADAAFFACGGGLPACDNKLPADRHDAACGFCSGFATSLLRLWGHRYYTHHDLVSSTDAALAWRATQDLSLAECRDFVWEGLPLGRLCFLSVVRLHRVSCLTAEHTEQYRRMLASAVQIALLGQRLLARERPDVLVTLNGRFFADSIMLHLARTRGVRVVCHERGDRSDDLVLAHDRPAVPYNLDAVWPRFAPQALTAEQEALLDRYLAARGAAGGVKGFWPHPESDRGRIAARWGLRPDQRTAVLFTNVVWDSSVVGQDVAFASTFDWLRQTVDLFAARWPDARLLIRIHPAEVRVRPAERTVETAASVLARLYPTLPANVTLIPPDDDTSSYTLLDLADLALVYASSVGLEAATRGLPVVVAAHTHYRGKGFTYDADSPERYERVISELLTADRDDQSEAHRRTQVELARRYAYLLYHRFMIPLPLVTVPQRGMPRLAFQRLDDLLPGRCRELDTICDGILHGTEFLRSWV